MGSRHWWSALLFLVMMGLVKAHMLFIRLVILAAAGLAGLFLLHTLAQDYRKIQANRPKAFGLFKRSIPDVQDMQLLVPITPDIDTKFSQAHKQLELLQQTQRIPQSGSLLRLAAQLDPNGCARRFVCSLAARPTSQHTGLESSLLDLIQQQPEGGEFKSAVRLGLQVKSHKECAARFPDCSYSVTEMLRLIQPAY